MSGLTVFLMILSNPPMLDTGKRTAMLTIHEVLTVFQAVSRPAETISQSFGLPFRRNIFHTRPPEHSLHILQER